MSLTPWGAKTKILCQFRTTFTKIDTVRGWGGGLTIKRVRIIDFEPPVQTGLVLGL